MRLAIILELLCILILLVFVGLNAEKRGYYKGLNDFCEKNYGDNLHPYIDQNTNKILCLNDYGDEVGFNYEFN